MAGFFGLFDFTKPGKGVDKDAPEKHPFFLFFELVWRKLSRLMLLNLFFLIIILPILTAIYYVFDTFILVSMEQMGLNLSDAATPILHAILLSFAYSMPDWMAGLLLAVSVVLYGPASCGMAYMLRNFARQQHAWNSDFFDKLKQNFKQGLALGLLDIFLLCLFVFNIVTTSGTEVSLMLTVARYVSMGLLIIYLFIRNYIFVLAVTFHLKFAQLLKNAWIFSVLGLWRNLLVFVVNGALFVLVLLSPLAELITVPLLLFSFTGFVSMFTCFPVVKKYLIDPQSATENVK